MRRAHGHTVECSSLTKNILYGCQAQAWGLLILSLYVENYVPNAHKMCCWDNSSNPKPGYMRVPSKTDKLIFWVENDVLAFIIWDSSEAIISQAMRFCY